MPCETTTKTFKICRCCQKWRCQCLVPRERKPRPPFNSELKHNVKIGMHPKFYEGKFDSPPVGSYNLPNLRRSTAPNWARQLETAEFSATMGGRLLEKYAMEREHKRTGLGPGTHEVIQWPDDVLKKTCKTIRKDVGFGTVPLFKSDMISTIPGPGYTKTGPYHYMEEKERIGSSCLPTFEYDGLRPRSSTISKPWSQPCNLYNVKHPKSIEAFLKKVTGKRGPYDLFTGPRDDRTLIGYQKPSKLEDSGDWPASLPSELDRLLHKSNYIKGRWTTCPRFPKASGLKLMLQHLALSYKDPKHPGPGHYNPKSPSKPKNRKNYPFNSNIDIVRPGPPFQIRPGPTRYQIKEKEFIRGHGWTCVFKSKLPRTNFIFVPTYRSF